MKWNLSWCDLIKGWKHEKFFTLIEGSFEKKVGMNLEVHKSKLWGARLP